MICDGECREDRGKGVSVRGWVFVAVNEQGRKVYHGRIVSE